MKLLPLLLMAENTLNKVNLIGYVQNDPIVRYFSETNIKAYFPLVTYDEYKSNTESKKIPEYHNIIAWKELATKVEDSIYKGQLVEITGRLKTHRYEKDGETKTAVQIVISAFNIIEIPKETNHTLYPPSKENTILSDLDSDLFESDDEDYLPF
ncbi:MAG: single-stranded DNA-binding protein [Crocinitomicaceae bacterium]